MLHRARWAEECRRDDRFRRSTRQRAHESAILFMQQHEHPIQSVSAVVAETDVAMLRAAVKDVHVEQVVGDYIVDIVGATRGHPSLIAGASPRGHGRR